MTDPVILLGTQSNGETLPVQVNSFGQLVAEGLQGPEGPQGPPGIGQLPPDPFEGALLGWENGQLAWLGGSIPLPPSTYGPFTYANGLLEVPQDVDIPYGTRLVMTDAEAVVANYVPLTTTIQNVNEATLTLTFPGAVSTNPDLQYFKEGDVVQDNSEWNQSEVWSTNIVSNGIDSANKNKLTDNDVRETYPNETDFNNNSVRVSGAGAYIRLNNQNIEVKDSISVLSSNWNTGTNEENYKIKANGTEIGSYRSTDASNRNKAVWTDFAWSGTLTQLEVNGGGAVNGAAVKIVAFRIDGKTLVDTGLSGDPGTKFTVISTGYPDSNTMVVDGGKWKGSDGTGDINGDTKVEGPIKSGSGTVSVTFGKAIQLREDNGQWIDGFYVHVPAQKIATRRVLVSSMDIDDLRQKRD